MSRPVSILLAEPNWLLREKMAGVIARHEDVWCVIQVGVSEGMLRAAGEVQPDLVLADLRLLHDGTTVRALRARAPSACVFALAEQLGGPYLATAVRLGLDGLLDKAHLSDELREQLPLLSTRAEAIGVEPH